MSSPSRWRPAWTSSPFVPPMAPSLLKLVRAMMKTQFRPKIAAFEPPREPATKADNTETVGRYKAPIPEPNTATPELEAFVGEQEAQAQKKGETLLDLIIANAREGRWGHSKFKDPEKLNAGVSAPKHAVQSAQAGSGPERSAGDVEASRARANNSIREARSEVELVSSSPSPRDSTRITSRLEALDKNEARLRSLMEHV